MAKPNDERGDSSPEQPCFTTGYGNRMEPCWSIIKISDENSRHGYDEKTERCDLADNPVQRFTQQCVREMSAIELTNGQQVERRDEQPKPSCTEHGVMIDFRHRRHKAVRIRERPFHETVDEGLAEGEFDRAGLMRHVRKAGMDLLQVVDAGQRGKSNGECGGTHNEARNRPRHTDVEHHFIRWHPRPRPYHRAERSEIDRAIHITRKWNVVRQRRIDAMNPRCNKMSELVCSQESDKKRRIFEAEMKVREIGNIMLQPAPRDACNRRREVGEDE